MIFFTITIPFFSEIRMTSLNPNNKATVESLFNALNEYRLENNLNPLKRDPNLDKAAQFHSDYMAKKNQITHDGPPGNEEFSTRMKNNGADYYSGAENVAQNNGDNWISTFDGWKKSLGHNENMLGNYEYIGIAYSMGDGNKSYWTQNFGAKRRDGRSGDGDNKKSTNNRPGDVNPLQNDNENSMIKDRGSKDVAYENEPDRVSEEEAKREKRNADGYPAEDIASDTINDINRDKKILEKIKKKSTNEEISSDSEDLVDGNRRQRDGNINDSMKQNDGEQRDKTKNLKDKLETCDESSSSDESNSSSKSKKLIGEMEVLPCEC